MILIEMDITQERKDVVVITDVGGRKIMQQVRYEWVPVFCAKSLHIRHNCDTF